MAPARKKKRVQVVGSELSSSEGHDKGSSRPNSPVSELKDMVGSLPSVKPLPRSDETEHLNLRRKTYFVQGGDPSEENEPCIIHHDPVETSNAVEDKMRRLTYVITPLPNGHAESPLMNPGIEMIHSELEKTGIQLEPPTLQDSKPKKRGEKKNSVPALQENAEVMESKRPDAKKKKKNESLVTNAPAAGKPRRRAQKTSASSKDAQVKTLESENETEIATVKAKGRKKKVQGQEDENILTGSRVQKKPAKKGKRKNAD